MSDDEFDPTGDLETFLEDSTPSAAGRRSKRAPLERDALETPDILAPDLLSRDDLNAALETLRAEIRREVLAEVAKTNGAISEHPVAPAPVPATTSRAERLEPEQAPPGVGTLVHFIADGFTIGGRVFYRGQEFRAPESAYWATLTATEQVARFGRQYFRPGPWEGQEYNLDDPSLTVSERQRLANAVRKRQEALAQYI